MENLSAQRTIARIAKVVSYAMYFWLLVSMVVLVLGFILRLFGANPDAGFTQWAYRNLDRVMEPFRGIFEPVTLGSGANDVPATVDTSILFAMVVYGIIVLALRALIHWINYRVELVDRQVDALHANAPGTPGATPTPTPYDTHA